MWKHTVRQPVAALGVALLAGGCSGVFDVEAPGRIADDDLNDRDAVSGIVVGMSYDLASAMNGVLETSSLAAGELWHGGSYNLGDVPRGIILPEDVNGEWGTMMQARWVTEHGIERIRTLLPEAEFAESPDVARAYLLAGFANRLVGEMVCETVHDGGAPEANTMEFQRGIANFDQAIAVGTAAGADDIVNAAYAGRASLRAWMGDWAGADADAQLVPASFTYEAILMTAGANNDLYYETHDRYEYTVFSTEFANAPNDARAPWRIIYRNDGSVATGANGSTPMYQQAKYEDIGADIPLAKGTEMLVLRAEAALRNSDVATATSLMNQARAEYGMAALPAAATATLADAWTTLHFERGATTWLENRRLWDLRRWFAETGVAHHDFLNGRDECIPISEEEADSNPNVP